MQPVPNFDHRLVTTAFTLDGYHIVRHYGVVRGIIVRSRSVIGNIGAGFQALFGGNITLYTELCERARSDAYEIMIQHAAALGANAIIGVHYDATEIASGITEVLCYGTAVYVVPAQPQPGMAVQQYAAQPPVAQQHAAERAAPPIPPQPQM